MRHRLTLQDLSLLVATVLVAAYVLFQVDVFVAPNAKPADHSIEWDELPILGTVLCLGLLIFSWRRLRQQKHEAAERAEAQEQLRKLAFQDPLTGLPNRRRFLDGLQMAIAAPPRSGVVHAVVMLDLNGFKKINDFFGHGAGDQALVIVGQRLLGLVRDGDLVARLGGDEFAILAKQLAGPEGATSLGLRIVEALSLPLLIGNVRHVAGAGVGICLMPFDGATPEEVLRRADVALYRAKAERQSAMRFFDEAMDQQVQERDRIENELRQAIDKNEIRPFFQPLVDLKTKRIIGFEALARWTHESLGSIPPDRFIAIAEDTGLIDQLTDQLLTLSCEAAQTWPKHIFLAFNVSGAQLKDPTFGLRVLKILLKTGLVPSRLEVEITESALVQDLEAAREVLSTLRQAGISIALDDFGTGYSSLFHLRAFKPDKIKIDRSFVEKLGSERESSEIVAALIGLGNGLGLTITAEGVEGTSAASDLLLKGCQQGQGYLFGQAMCADEAVALLGPSERSLRRIS